MITATGIFWLIHGYVDKGQASLLYLPVVIACAIRFGFGPAVLAAVLSFFSWNFFFLRPTYRMTVHDPKDLLSLVVFLAAAVTTAQLAARAQQEAAQARSREAEIATLFEASEALSHEVSAARLLPLLAEQLQTLCHAVHCLVFRYSAAGQISPVTAADSKVSVLSEAQHTRIEAEARRACVQNQIVGFDKQPTLAMAGSTVGQDLPGVFVPLHAADTLVGLLHVGPRQDGQPFSSVEERLILTLANHAATVLARERLAEEAAQAAALREADSLKDALLSLVSHELRTPLAAIKASASGLLQRDAHWNEESRRESLSAIDREADRLS
ncbi:MAG: DUF4118 domain-containing protein, partial [Armatimonadota bacterium]